MRLLIATLLFLLPAPVMGQLMTADQDARVKAIIGQLGPEVERCSLAVNASHREGPAKVQLDFDSRGKLRKLAVLGDLRRKDVGKCIAKFKPTEPLPTAKFRGGKTMRLEFSFHPWAGLSKRSWSSVKKKLKDDGADKALSTCVADAGKERPKTIEFAMKISRDGKVEALPNESALDPCFAAAVESLQFPPSENHYRVEYKWTPKSKPKSKPRKTRGLVVKPRKCEVERYPCSWEEADPARVRLGNDYVKQLGTRIDCTNPEPAVKWLEKQKHIRWVHADGCNVSLLVDGSRPMSFFSE